MRTAIKVPEIILFQPGAFNYYCVKSEVALDWACLEGRT